MAILLSSQSGKIRQIESLWLSYQQVCWESPSKLYTIFRSPQKCALIDPVLNQKLLSEVNNGKNILPVLEKWLDFVRDIRIAIQNRERFRNSLIVRWAFFSLLLWVASFWFWMSTDGMAGWIRSFVINGISGQTFCAIVGRLWWRFAPVSQFWQQGFTPKALRILTLQASDSKINPILEIGGALLDAESDRFQAYIDWAPLWEIFALGGMATLVLGLPGMRHFGI